SGSCIRGVASSGPVSARSCAARRYRHSCGQDAQSRGGWQAAPSPHARHNGGRRLMPAALPAAVPAPSTTSLPDGGETLTSPPPALPAGLAAPLAQAHFGVTCADVEVLTAERDQNLLLRGDDGRAWVMKIANPGEAHAITDFQTAALCHLEQAAPDLPVPRIRRAVDGATRAVVTLPDGRRSLVRMLAWLDGRPLADAPRSPRQRQNLAACLAGLGRA